MQTTPKGLRLQIGIFGRRNSGKSSIMNALTYQDVSIVSDVPGTTTDPVEKPMELLPLGPVVFIDTAGLDDVGALGAKRITKSQKIIERADIAVIVNDSNLWDGFEEGLIAQFRKRGIPIIAAFNKTDIYTPSNILIEKLSASGIKCIKSSTVSKTGINELRNLIIESVPEKFLNSPKIVRDLVRSGEIVILVIPIDKEAPKGRVILPQVQTLRELLDNGNIVLSVRESELADSLKVLNKKPVLVITDSQAFEEVSKVVPADVKLTGFSVLFARFKGDFTSFADGARAIKTLKLGDKVLIAESCAHHPIGEDIGRIKIPKWLSDYAGGEIKFDTCQGHDFPENLSEYKLVIQCGGCIFNRQAMLSRIAKCKDANVPITNYGLAIAYLKGIFDRATEIFYS